MKKNGTQNWELGKYFHFEMPVTFYESILQVHTLAYIVLHTHTVHTEIRMHMLGKIATVSLWIFKRMKSWAQEMFVIKSKRM